MIFVLFVLLFAVTMGAAGSVLGVPLARGGCHGYSNVQPAHPSCNASKNVKLAEEMV